MACGCLARHNVDVAVLTETKTQGFCPAKAAGYDIVATVAASQHQGGVALAFRSGWNWHVEDTKAIGPNIAQGTIVHGGERTTVFGVYIPLSEDNRACVTMLGEAMRKVDDGKIILLGDLNITWKRSKDKRQQEIADELRSFAIRDVALRFWPRRGRQHW